jgi:predicted phosphodiesterase
VNGNRAIVLGVVLALFVAVTVFALLAGRLTPPSSAPPSRTAGGDRPSVSSLPSPSLPSPSLPSESPSSPTGSPSPDGGESPTPTRPPVTRIAAVGDTGTGDDAQLATVQEMVDQTRDGEPYEALVLLGDLVYEEGDAELVDDRVTEPFAPLVEDGTELVPVLGNHDYESDEQDEILAALGRDRSWYVERIGSVRVVALDSERIDDPEQLEWLEDTLAEPQPPGTWTVAAMHRPAYSAGEHGSDESVQEHWVPLFEEYDVPLVLAGHDHDYQRSEPIDDVVYVVSGGGAKLRPAGEEDFTAVSTSTLHYLELVFHEKRIVGKAIDQSGEVIDAFAIGR